MEDNPKLLETLLERATDYGNTTFELVKLKALDKTSDVVSSVVPHSVVIVMITSFVLFLNLGIAFWLAEILGKTFYGFFAVAAFYLITGAVIYFFMFKRIKKAVRDFVIKQLLK
jgi:hypothetical protein